MKLTILIPHFKTGKMTAFTVAQFLKYKGKHELDIVVIDNHAGDGSIKYIDLFLKDITIVGYPKDKLQSHGIGFDYIMPHVRTEFCLTAESDSYPTKENWLDYYEHLFEKGYDCIGSLLKLSGGQYIHPAGMMFKKSVWLECKDYCDHLEYSYFPNMSYKDGFDCHLMVHESIFDEFVKEPEDYIVLAENYKPYTPLKAIEKLEYYKPVCGPFHNGMGGRQESVRTYGLRTMDSETPFAILNYKNQKLINRIGLEPGQFFSYYQNAVGKKLFYVPTEVKWLPNRENQQQEYTLMENGFRHIWGVSAYYGVAECGNKDILDQKQSLPELLYDSLPDHQKIIL